MNGYLENILGINVSGFNIIGFVSIPMKESDVFSIDMDCIKLKGFKSRKEDKQ